jgi:hypothetical protein
MPGRFDSVPKTKLVVCALCHKPLDLETAKTDEDGQAVHAECYFQKVKRPKTP